MNAKIYLLALLLAACLIAALPGVEASADSVHASISGLVVDSHSKSTVAGASVTAYDEATKRPVGAAVTDVSGRFTVPVSRGGWIVLVLSHPWYFDSSTLAIRVHDAAPVSLAKPIEMYTGSSQLLFVRGAISGVEPASGSQWQQSAPPVLGPALVGRVERADTHAALAGVIVAAYIAPYAEARAAAVSDVGGRFVFLGLPSGMYTLHATTAAFASKTIEDVGVDDEKRISLSVPIQLDVETVRLDDKQLAQQHCADLIRSAQAGVYVVCGS
jgi:hypothetical protein